METSAVLTIVVSMVERKSAIQSLPTVSLCTAAKIDSSGFEVWITQASTCATSSLVYRQDLVALPPPQLTWALATGRSQYAVAGDQMTKDGGLLITKLTSTRGFEGTVEVSMQLGIFLRGHDFFTQIICRRRLCLHKQDEVSRRLTTLAGTGMGGWVGLSASCRAREHDCRKKFYMVKLASRRWTLHDT